MRCVQLRRAGECLAVGMRRMGSAPVSRPARQHLTGRPFAVVLSSADRAGVTPQSDGRWRYVITPFKRGLAPVVLLSDAAARPAVQRPRLLGSALPAAPRELRAGCGSCAGCTAGASL